jgi:hypothetical protein
MNDFNEFFASEPNTAQTDIHRKEFDLLPDGEYEATLSKATLVAGSKGMQLDFEFRITNSEAYQNRRLWKSLYFYNKSEGNVKFVKTYMSILGASLSEAKSLENAAKKASELVGSCYKIKVYASEYNGKKKNEFYLNKKIDFVTAQNIAPDIDKADFFGAV